MSQSVRLRFELRVGPALLPTAKCHAIRHAVSDRLPEICQVESTHTAIRFPMEPGRDRAVPGVSGLCRLDRSTPRDSGGRTTSPRVRTLPGVTHGTSSCHSPGSHPFVYYIRCW